MTACSKCGQPLPATVTFDVAAGTLSKKGKVAQLTPSLAAIIGMLVRAKREYVPIDRLMLGLWPDGEPETAGNCLRVHVANLRQRLAPLGMKIEWSRWVPGYRLVIS